MKEELENILDRLAVRMYDEGQLDKPSLMGRQVAIVNINEAITSIINLVDKELPEHKHIKVPYNLVELQKAYENGYNQAIDDMRAKLKGVSE